ncbi:MAG: sigma 54-interacting transcriptional regulator [Myxococcota bacterium]
MADAPSLLVSSLGVAKAKKDRRGSTSPTGLADDGPLFAGRYGHRAELGRGAAGRVLLVADAADDGALRAMKVVPPEEAARLRWEFELLSAIAHPHVARVYELLRVSEPVGEPFRLAPGDAALIEQYVEGEPAERVADAMDTDADRIRFAVSAGRCLALALAAVHGAGMVHGDVKPQNLIVAARGGDAVLIDLGLANPPGPTGRAGGTPGYMAPEAWQGERSVGTDLYAVGATLHRLLAGRVPGDDVAGRPVAEVVARALSRWRPGAILPEATPPALRQLVEALLAPEPGERPASAREVAARLEGVAAELGEASDAIAVAGAQDRPSPAEQAMTMRALPWVGERSLLDSLVTHLSTGGVVAVVGPHGAGRSRLVWEAIRVLQERRAEEERTVPTAVRVEAGLPREGVRHDAIVHVQAGDDVDPADARGMVRAARLEGHHLAIVLERREPLEGAHANVAVGPLDTARLRTLLSHALRQAPNEGQLEAARRVSGGLAGRLCRILAAGLAAGTDVRKPQALAGLGVEEDAAAEVVVAPAARAVAELVAVAGGELDPDEVVAALGGAGRFDLLVADGLATLTDRGRLRLRDDVARALRASLAPGRRRELAGLIPVEGLSPHARGFVLAARGEQDAAAGAFLSAVRRRRRLGDAVGAARLAEDAQTELGRGPEVEDAAAEASAALRLERGDALRAAGRYAEAARALDGIDAAAAALLRAEVARLQGDAAGAAGEATRAAERATSAEERMRAEAILARLDLDAGRLEAALARAGEVREAAVAAGADGEAARALETMALGHLARGELEETGRLASEAVGRARRAGDRVGEARARSIAATVAMRSGRVQAAARGHVDAFELADAAGEAHAAATFLANVGLARLDAGEPGPAIVALREGARRLARLGREHDLARILYNLANAAMLVGDDALAQSAAAKAEEAAGSAGDASAEAWSSVVRAELALRGDAREAAREACAHAAEWIAHLVDPSARAALASRCATFWLELSDEMAAAEALERAREAGPAAGGDPVAEVEWRVAEVRAALHGRDVDGAREHAMAGWAAAEQAGLFELRLRAGFALADASEAAGDRQAAAQALSEVRSLLDAAANTLEAAARTRMRAVAAYRRAFAQVPDERAGAPSPDARWRHLASYAKRLTAERRVARLYEAILEAAVELTGAERGYVVSRDDSGGLRVREARGMDRRELARDVHAFSRSVVERALDGGQPMRTVDALRDETLQGAASIHALDLRSVLAVPVRRAGEVQAAIYLDDRLRPGAFGPDDVDLIVALAELGAVALESAERLRRERRAARRLAVLQRKLERTVEAQSLELASLKRATEGAPLEGSGIVARSEPMRRAMALAEKVAPSEVPVLVTGESGTGKELVARAIHAHGGRRDAPFVTESCGAVPETLLESVLFGHVRGAFTGAHRDRVGLFEAADGGTLFLDEIGEMSPAMQTKLLRAVQSGEIRPVGSERVRKVNVRILAATHRDLEAMVREGAFREDLYYRLAVVTVALPPLRERPDDIPALVSHFLVKHGGARPPRIAPPALRLLQRFPWPGNVRQLENEIQRAVVLADATIREEHLSDAVRGLAAAGRADAPDALDLKGQVDALERRLIREALERTAGNQTRAAQLLGVSRYGLQKMIKRLGIDASRP